MRDSFLNISKFIGFAFLFPLVISSTISFSGQIKVLEFALTKFFWAGVISYVIVHLFLFDVKGFFWFGQKFIADLCRFSPSFGVFCQYVIPFYTTLLLIILLCSTHLFHWNTVNIYLMLFVGFTLAMHVTLTAQDLNDEDSVALKPHYCLSMSATYLANLLVVALLLNLAFAAFSFAAFFQNSGNLAKIIYSSIYQKLFVLGPI